MTRVPQSKSWRIAILTANALIALCTVTAAYGGMINPVHSAIPAIVAMTFPVILLICALMLFADLFIFTKAALIPAATLLCSAGPILQICPLNVIPPQLSDEQRKDEFKVVSYNVYGFANTLDTDTARHNEKYYRQRMRQGFLNPQMSYLIHSGADIICLQERSWNQEQPFAYISQSQCDSLHAIYPYDAGFGVCVQSRMPMKPIKLRQPKELWAEFGAAEVNIGGEPVLVISVHLQSIGLNSEDKELYVNLTKGEGGNSISKVRRNLLSKLKNAFIIRAAQARLLREQIDSLGYENVLVCGDFNDIPSCYAMRVIAGNDFRSAFAQSGLGPIITYHMNRFYFHIDHILYRGKMRPVSFSRGKIANSDHYPIEARFVWDSNQ